MLRINTVTGHERMSTQELLLTIAEAVEAGETEFQILASGQHDIGGPLWNREGRPLFFTVANPGQRAGSMCLPGTTVIVDGSAPADVGWLNAGGIIAVKGDAGDTAGHCAAAGKIYIGGRAGARTGSLMKHDPAMPPPELWILNSTGSFSFEFMGGGTAVICGHDSQTLKSVLGHRPCVGMVGGTVYFRGPVSDIPPDVEILPIDEKDIAWLESGLEEFLDKIGGSRYKAELSVWKHWRKLVPAKVKETAQKPDVAAFKAISWPPQGLFGDILNDDGQTLPLVVTGKEKLREPVRINADSCVDCRKCAIVCPQGAIKRRLKQPDKKIAEYQATSEKCIGCGFCAAVCPQSVWQMHQF